MTAAAGEKGPGADEATTHGARGIDRRAFLAVLVGGAAGAGGGLAARSVAQEAPWLRPPGAASERSLLALCIRCGQCLEACPPEFDAIRLVPLGRGLRGGTPHVVARTNPCGLCQGHDGLACIDACPTGALAPVADRASVRMGVARLDPETCWAHHGTVCRACWHACPWPNEAIVFDPRLRPLIVDERCVGCGLCARACPSDPASIAIEPFGTRREAPA